MNNISGQIEYLKNRQSRLDAGEELCDHHFNNSDLCYEVYCTACGTHLMEERDENEIPFKDEALCFSCQETPEEKERERSEIAAAKKVSDLEKLKHLIKTYPCEANDILDRGKQ